MKSFRLRAISFQRVMKFERATTLHIPLKSLWDILLVGISCFSILLLFVLSLYQNQIHNSGPESFCTYHTLVLPLILLLMQIHFLCLLELESLMILKTSVSIQYCIVVGICLSALLSLNRGMTK